MSKDEIRNLMNLILEKRGLPPVSGDDADLRTIGFRSLDFSEMALRVERKVGHELNFDAALMRAIQTVADVLGFFEQACRNA